MALPAPRVLSLFSGAGGTDLAIARVFPGARVVCHVEIDVPAALILAARMEDGRLDEAPIWSDVRTFDGRRWRGAVDCVAASWPCQPFSVAGKRLGVDDPRHLWPHVARLLDETGAPVLVGENVAGHLGLGFDVVARDLHRLGYRTAAGLFTAAEVGAPHRRERLFIVGVRDGLEYAAGAGSVVAKQCVSGWQERAADISRPDGTTVRYAALPRWPPGPADTAGWQWVLARWPDLAPAVAVEHREQSRRPTTGQRPQQHAGAEPEAGSGGGAVADPGRLRDAGR